MTFANTNCLATVLLATIPFAFTVKSDSTEPTKRVLILYSQRLVLPINFHWDRGIRKGLESNLRQPLAIDVEYLDIERLRKREHRDRWAELLRMKYENNSPDIVIPVNDSATEWVAEWYPDLFPQAAKVFCSVSENAISRLRPDPSMTGVAYRLDYRKTVETARLLFPSTRSVIVVNGTAEVDMRLLQSAQAEFNNSRLADLELVYWTGLPVAELCERASQLKVGTIILYLSQVRDRDGRLSVTSVDVARQLCESAAVPVFGLYDTLMGTGILGGSLGMVERQGQRAGAIAARVIQGELPSDIPVSGTEMNQTVFDWRQLHRWRIPEQNLPPGSLILFRESTFWQQFWAPVLAGSAAICVQTLTILGLMVGHRKRLRVERSLIASRAEARLLTGRLLKTQEEEMKTLARELHDDFSQRLAANAIFIGGMEQPLIAGDPMRGKLATIRERLIELSKDMHRVSRQLHPSILEELGLADAIRSECHFWKESSKTKFSFACGKLPTGISGEVALCLFRVAQEALRNAAKHACANHVHLVLDADDQWIRLHVQDDGCGFAGAIVPSQPGLGLASMRERVFLVGGHLNIESAVGQGTNIVARIPRAET